MNLHETFLQKIGKNQKTNLFYEYEHKDKIKLF